MTYLIESNSPKDNFKLMAHGIWGTKEDHVLQNKSGLTHQVKEHKLKVITFLAFSILFCSIGYMNQDPMTLVPLLASAAITIYEAIKLKSCIKKLTECEEQLKKNFESLNRIYQAVIQFIHAKRQTKTTFIQEAIHRPSYDNHDFLEHFKSIASNFDMNQEPHFSNDIKSIRENFKPIPEIPARAFLKIACDEYANCSLLYNHLSKTHIKTLLNT